MTFRFDQIFKFNLQKTKYYSTDFVCFEMVCCCWLWWRYAVVLDHEMRVVGQVVERGEQTSVIEIGIHDPLKDAM